MDRAAKQHVDELLKLPVEERSAAAEALLLSLEDNVDDVDAAEAWTKEIERRIVEDAPGIPAETVFAEGRARLNAKP
jgi:hypothetical protein